MQSNLISAREASELLRAHLSTVHRWIRQGTLKGYRRGGRYFVCRDSVQAFVVPVVGQDCPPTRGHEQAMGRLARAGFTEEGV